MIIHPSTIPITPASLQVLAKSVLFVLQAQDT